MGSIAKQTMYKGIVERIREKDFYDHIIQLINEDPRVCYVTCDGLPEGTSIRRAHEKYPDRIMDVGIAEQNLVGVAAGLALSGKRPLAVSMSSFLTMRAFEQIHTDVAYNNAPVRLIGLNNGTSGGTGPTHDSICDLAILNAIPNMTVIVPSDKNHFWKALRDTMELNKPIYFRLPRYEDPEIYREEVPFRLGGANVLKKGTDITIISTGRCVYNALEAANGLISKNVSVGVIDMYSIKPMDRAAVLIAARETGRILTVEDHNTQGGLGTLVAAAVAESGITCQLIKVGIPDEFAIFGPRNEIASHYGLDTLGIENAILSKFLFS